MSQDQTQIEETEHHLDLRNLSLDDVPFLLFVFDLDSWVTHVCYALHHLYSSIVDVDFK